MNIQNTLQELIIKVTFREKYMKKKGIELITAEIEEEMADADETFDYSNMNIRDGGETVWILCNQAGERVKIRDYLLQKEVTLAIESDGKRFFGKFASKVEKDKYREVNKDGGNLFGKKNVAAADEKKPEEQTKKPEVASGSSKKGKRMDPKD